MSYKEALKQGKIERSNLEVNKEFLKELKVLKTNHKILEIGCGAGSMTAYLAKKGYQIIGTDLSKDMIDYAKKTHPAVEFKKMSGDKLNFKNESFDIVLSFDLVEHIPDVEKHFKEVNRVLKKDGKYIFVTPNKLVNVPYNIIKNKSLNGWKKHHMSVQTKKSLRKLCKKTGFEVEIKKVKAYEEYIDKKLRFPLNIMAKKIRTALHAVAIKK